jgi:hypothetical protein
VIRIVLAGWADDEWRPYRQPQWMAQVRQSPESARLPRLHFDIDEDAYTSALAEWDGSSREAAVALLLQFGAVEVRRG